MWACKEKQRRILPSGAGECWSGEQGEGEREAEAASEDERAPIDTEPAALPHCPHDLTPDHESSLQHNTPPAGEPEVPTR
jgi:hypothetical protein